jgi:hypothetical protein
MFKIGEKVVCINDQSGWLSAEKKLVKGEIYEVLQVMDKDIVVIPNDAGWDKSRFRKLDYEFAENLLEKIKQEVSVGKFAQAVC